MVKTAILLVLFFSSLPVHSAASVELLYSKMRFSLPSGFTLVGDMGGEDNVLIFRYGDALGKDFIAFTDMTDDTSVEYGCTVSSFFDTMFSSEKNPECDKELLGAMKEVFINGKTSEAWVVGDKTVYFSSGDGKTFAFIRHGSEKLVKVDSDFLDKEGVRGLFGSRP